MSTDKPESSNTPGAERRRARRLSLIIPVEVEWTGSDGARVREPARARNVSVSGALLHMRNLPRRNAEVAMTCSLSGEAARARVQAIRRASDGKLLGVAVELLAPSETFWGLTFQLQGSTAQLLEIERALQANPQGIDFRLLRDLRAAVEDLRDTASAVHRWQDLRVEGEDAYAVLEVQSVARVRRATHLLEELSTDVDAEELAQTTEGFTGLLRAVERIYDRLTRSSPAQRA